jgi:hypothetical protein
MRGAAILTAVLWVVLLLAAGYATYRVALGYPRPSEPHAHLARREVAFLEAAAEAMFPSGGAIPLSGREACLPRYVDRYFAALHSGKRLQIRLLLLFFEQATILFPGPGRGGRRRFSSLAPAQRDAVLHAWAGSRMFARRLVVTALRGVLTLGYLGHPVALRHLGLAPRAIEVPVCEADLLYPRAGLHPDTIAWTEADLTPPSDGTPIDLSGPLHPDYAEGRT